MEVPLNHVIEWKFIQQHQLVTQIRTIDVAGVTDVAIFMMGVSGVG